MLRNDEIELLEKVGNILANGASAEETSEVKSSLDNFISKMKEGKKKKNERDARYKREHRALDPNYCR